jgi:hypothetical protein
MDILPTPPTDSLYKFKAISGIVLVIAGFYFQTRVIRDVAVFSERLVTATDDGRINRLTRLNRELLHLIQNLTTASPAVEESEADKAVSLPNTTKRLADANDARFLAILAGVLLTLATVMQLFLNLCCFAVILGSIGMTARGFQDWYVRVQKPQDELLQIQLEQAGLALLKAKAEAASRPGR